MSENHILTNTSMNTLKTCATKYWYSYVAGLKREEHAAPLRVGIAVHEALDVFATMMKDEYLWSDCVQAAFDSALDMFPEPGVDPNAWLAAAMVESYLRHYGDVERDWKVIASELTVRTPIINPDTKHSSTKWTYAGKIDKIIERNGELWLLDYKTTTEDVGPDSLYVRALPLNSQVSLYWNAAKDLGYDVKGMLFNIIRRPLMRPKWLSIKDTKDFFEGENGGHYCGYSFRLDGGGSAHATVDGVVPERELMKGGWRIRETNAMYAARVVQSMLEQPGNFFRAFELERDYHELLMAQYDMWQTVQTLNMIQRKDLWPRNTTQCRGHYGKCPYFDVCVSGGWRFGEHVPDGYTLTDNLHPELDMALLEEEGYEGSE